MVAPKHERLRAADVCQLAQVQPYVLRTWEAEFPDLGREMPGGARIYGRADVQRVLRIRELVYGEGLTLAGARRRLEESAGGDEPPVEDLVLVDEQTRTRLASVKRGLQGVLDLLNRPVAEMPFALEASAEVTRGPRKSKRSA